MRRNLEMLLPRVQDMPPAQKDKGVVLGDAGMDLRPVKVRDYVARIDER